MQLIVQFKNPCYRGSDISAMEGLYTQKLITLAHGANNAFWARVEWDKMHRPSNHLWSIWNRIAFAQSALLGHSPTATNQTRVCVLFKGSPIIYDLPPISLLN